MREFIINIYEKYILFPQGVTPESRIFKWEHFLCSGIIIIAIIFLIKNTLKKDIKQREKLLFNIALIMFSLEVFRVLWWMLCRYEGQYSFIVNFLKALRFDWCNQVCLIMPILVMLKKRKTYDILAPMALIGGFGVLMYPVSVFDDYAGLHLAAIQSMISHGLMFFISLLFIYSKELKPNVKNLPVIFVGFGFAITLAGIMANNLPGIRTNYMSYHSSMIPLIGELKHPLYLFIQFPMMLEGIIMVYCFMSMIYNRIHEKSKMSEEFKRLFVYNVIASVATIVIFIGLLVGQNYLF